VEDAGLLHDLEHLARLRRRAAERLGAQDSLAGLGRGAHRVRVQVVRQRDHHEVDVGRRHGLLDAGGPVRDAPLLGEGLRLVRVAPAHRDDAVATPLPGEAHRVEEPDQPRAEHRDVGHCASGCVPRL